MVLSSGVRRSVWKKRSNRLKQQIICTDKTKINLNQGDEKVWKKDVPGKLMCEAWWKCQGSLMFNDEITHDGSSTINAGVYRNMMSDNLQRRHSTNSTPPEE